jgi:hypothetical protein
MNISSTNAPKVKSVARYANMAVVVSFEKEGKEKEE